MTAWEDRYIGNWIDGNGVLIEINKIRKHHFLVSFFRDASPVSRPWMNDLPSTGMDARYIEDPLDGDDFVVEIYGMNGDYCLNLHYEEFDYFLPENGEILSVVFTGPLHCDQTVFQQCIDLFQCDGHLHRVQSINDEQ